MTLIGMKSRIKSERILLEINLWGVSEILIFENLVFYSKKLEFLEGKQVVRTVDGM
jgi:hypothetical protein